jgi:hypothetical protein
MQWLYIPPRQTAACLSLQHMAYTRHSKAQGARRSCAHHFMISSSVFYKSVSHASKVFLQLSRRSYCSTVFYTLRSLNLFSSLRLAWWMSSRAWQSKYASYRYVEQQGSNNVDDQNETKHDLALKYFPAMYSQTLDPLVSMHALKVRQASL